MKDRRSKGSRQENHAGSQKPDFMIGILLVCRVRLYLPALNKNSRTSKILHDLDRNGIMGFKDCLRRGKGLIDYLTMKPDTEAARAENRKTLHLLLIYGIIGCAGVLAAQRSTESYVICAAMGLLLFFCLIRKKEICANGTLALEQIVLVVLLAVTFGECAEHGEEPVFLLPLLLLFLPQLVFDAPWKMAAMIGITCTAGLVLIFVLHGLPANAFRIMAAGLVSLIHTCHVAHRRTMSVELRNTTHFKAQQDPLTGVYNRGGGTGLISHCIELRESGTFIIVDIDDFKYVNDTFGHKKGDEVLQNVAATLDSFFNGADIVMRMGGDEFIVYSAGMVDYAVSEKRLQQLVEELRKTTPVSIGAAINDGSYPTYNSLYEAADALLYITKENGKNGFTLRSVSYRQA